MSNILQTINLTKTILPFYKLELVDFKIVDDHSIRIYDNKITKEILRVLTLNDVEISSIGKKAESLEDYFLKMIGGSIK